MTAAGFRREFALGTVCGVIGRLRMEIRGDFYRKMIFFCFGTFVCVSWFWVFVWRRRARRCRRKCLRVWFRWRRLVVAED